MPYSSVTQLPFCQHTMVTGVYSGMVRSTCWQAPGARLMQARTPAGWLMYVPVGGGDGGGGGGGGGVDPQAGTPGRIVRTAAAGWDEGGIAQRNEELVDAVLATWPVPDGHQGRIRDEVCAPADYIELRHLVQAGAIPVGATLHATGARLHGVTGTVLDGGRVAIDGHLFDSPSGAARHLLGRQQNGYTFWRLEDGRRLEDVRADFRAGAEAEAGD